MQALRWKSRYRSGDAETDRLNKAVVACLNTLMDASRQQEHCSEVDDLLGNLAQRTDVMLRQGEASEVIRAGLRDTLLSTVPLPNYTTPACRNCGLCDLAEQKVAEHLKAPGECLAIRFSHE